MSVFMSGRYMVFTYSYHQFHTFRDESAKDGSGVSRMVHIFPWEYVLVNQRHIQERKTD